MQTGLDYRQQLRRALESRTARNPRYSLRAFARQIGMSPSHLSRVLNGQKDLSPRSALRVASELDLRGREGERFLDLVSLASASGSARDALERKIEKRGKRLARRELALDKFQAMADWHHLALFELTKTKSFRSEPQWIARRLGISLAETRAAIDRLAALGLLRLLPDGRIEAAENASLETTDDLSSLAIRKHHEQVSAKAARAVKEQDVGEREFQSVQLVFAPEKLARAKALIRDFASRFEEELGGGASEVYQLNLQFFRLTEREKP